MAGGFSVTPPACARAAHAQCATCATLTLTRLKFNNEMPRSYARRRNTRGATAARQKKARRSTYSKRRLRRKFRRYGFLGTLRGRNPFTQDRMSTVLKYNTVIGLNPPIAGGTTMGTNVWRFNINSMWDPDYTGLGHQPMYFDNYAALYQKYQVKYAKITATVINHYVNTTDGGTNNVNHTYKLFLYKDAEQTTDMPSNVEQLIELGGNNIKWRFASPSLTGILPKLHLGCAPHRLLNRSFRDDSLQAVTTGNPARPCVFYVGVCTSDGEADPPAVKIDIRITYYCDFFDRIMAQGQN